MQINNRGEVGFLDKKSIWKFSEMDSACDGNEYERSFHLLDEFLDGLIARDSVYSDVYVVGDFFGERTHHVVADGLMSPTDFDQLVKWLRGWLGTDGHASWRVLIDQPDADGRSERRMLLYANSQFHVEIDR